MIDAMRVASQVQGISLYPSLDHLIRPLRCGDVFDGRAFGGAPTSFMADKPTMSTRGHFQHKPKDFGTLQGVVSAVGAGAVVGANEHTWVSASELTDE